ncbi:MULTISPECIES: YezD family protein [unclassified Sphingobium]|jgi:hypothetical protein|uniref:YezD family protein n=1 Tax=unclassified Sphingobium TaxID=2611147 RepID=UPI0005059E07|nr:MULTISPECIES: YezD family protein [unclassified Sphingobium]AOF95732.1 hypothetical protein BSY17_2057 [Sphingobium sp. RAC03]KFL48453.1 hypothetical protein IL54_3885 [Sphingobium sp. ba1]
MTDQRPIELRHTHADTPRIDIAASIEKIRDALQELRFGSITLTVHDARVVQIDVTEKTRLTA